MFKFLIIFGIILYLIYKIGSLFFSAGAASQQFRNGQQNGRVNPQGKKPKKESKLKGGEYIDYEEVK
jgi:hypothetical protein